MSLRAFTMLAFLLPSSAVDVLPADDFENTFGGTAVNELPAVFVTVEHEDKTLHVHFVSREAYRTMGPVDKARVLTTQENLLAYYMIRNTTEPEAWNPGMIGRALGIGLVGFFTADLIPFPYSLGVKAVSVVPMVAAGYQVYTSRRKVVDWIKGKFSDMMIGE